MNIRTMPIGEFAKHYHVFGGGGGLLLLLFVFFFFFFFFFFCCFFLFFVLLCKMYKIKVKKNRLWKQRKHKITKKSETK